MKRLRALGCRLLAGLLCLCLAACGGAQGGGMATPYAPAEMAEVMLHTQQAPPALRALLPDDADFAPWLETNYLIDPKRVEDGVICYAQGFEATELCVLLLDGEEAVQDAVAGLEGYIESREKAFTGYAPDQARLARGGRVAVSGRYVALFILKEGGAGEAFYACFGADPPALPDPPVLSYGGVPSSTAGSGDVAGESGSTASSETGASAPAGGEDIYDAAAVLAAWYSGNEAGLTEKNRAILAACREVVNEVVNGEMTDYEAELAIHDWIIAWADYDVAELSAEPDAKGDPDNDNPYGTLINQTAICSGYTSTFQLFMDLLGIECITVNGTANADHEQHAWNQVRLEGEWYCVDVTWDDPVGAPAGGNGAMRHRFFNVTSRFMRETSHHWDAASVPECTATKYRWRAGA